MILLSIFLIVVFAVLWRLGGWEKGKAEFRDVGIPVIMFFYYWFTCNLLIGILAGGAANSIRMGYGAYDPEHDDKPSWLASITHDREGWKIRGIYGFITSFMMGIFPAIYNQSWLGFIVYVVFNTGLEIVINKRKTGDTMTELSNGAGRGLVFLLCR